MLRAFVLLVSLAIMTGCLRTRQDLKQVEETVVMRDQVTNLQKVHADSASRMDELLEQNRSLNGKIEELEFRIAKAEKEQTSGSEGIQKNLEDSKRQNELLQESLSKMETQLLALQEEIVALRARDSGRGSFAGDSKKEEKSRENNKEKIKSKEKDQTVFEAALASFEEKKWQEAILSFEQYRENPKGKYVAEAAYKTGVCFQELGMKDEAKVFYQDVVAKFPQSDMAKKAQYRLKNLK